MKHNELKAFISKYVTERAESMFLTDLRTNEDALRKGIRGKSVLVIGGAGSIGSSFIHALLPFEPAALTVVDTNENGLTELTRQLRSSKGFMPETYLTYPMDFASHAFARMFRARGGFDIVANFSAHKHVRSEKDIYSVEALLTNNVLHAAKLLDLLEEFPPESYFCVSTDKAANPVNIMGASKRVMEDLIFSRSEKFPVKTARFANVAFSNGSLPDGFLRRMDLLQPLSAPGDVKRFFVSPEESGQICLLACILGRNREIFFPKLAESQMKRFDTIAEALLTECGYQILRCASETEAIERAEALTEGSKDYPVFFFTSDTTGEKSYEEFFIEGEALDTERFESLGVILDKTVPERGALEQLLNALHDAFQRTDIKKEEIVRMLSSYLPEFLHTETGKNLDGRM